MYKDRKTHEKWIEELCGFIREECTEQRFEGLDQSTFINEVSKLANIYDENLEIIMEDYNKNKIIFVMYNKYIYRNITLDNCHEDTINEELLNIFLFKLNKTTKDRQSYLRYKIVVLSKKVSLQHNLSIDVHVPDEDDTSSFKYHLSITGEKKDNFNINKFIYIEGFLKKDKVDFFYSEDQTDWNSLERHLLSGLTEELERLEKSDYFDGNIAYDKYTLLTIIYEGTDYLVDVIDNEYATIYDDDGVLSLTSPNYSKGLIAKIVMAI